MSLKSDLAWSMLFQLYSLFNQPNDRTSFSDGEHAELRQDDDSRWRLNLTEDMLSLTAGMQAHRRAAEVNGCGENAFGKQLIQKHAGDSLAPLSTVRCAGHTVPPQLRANVTFSLYNCALNDM